MFEKTFTYMTNLVKNNEVRFSSEQTGIAPLGKKPSDIVNEWNRKSILQTKSHPQNGVWVFVLLETE